MVNCDNLPSGIPLAKIMRSLLTANHTQNACLKRSCFWEIRYGDEGENIFFALTQQATLTH